MLKVTIKPVDILHLSELQEISRITFRETYEWYNTKENMDIYHNVNFGEANLTKELNDPDSAFFFVTTEDTPIGYIKLNMGQAQTDLKEAHGLEVERIYVLKAFHGMQAGKIMIDHAIEYAKEKKLDFVWLGVWEKNENAKAFYEKQGFKQIATHTFKLGEDLQNDFIMKLEINNH